MLPPLYLSIDVLFFFWTLQVCLHGTFYISLPLILSKAPIAFASNGNVNIIKRLTAYTVALLA